MTMDGSIGEHEVIWSYLKVKLVVNLLYSVFKLFVYYSFLKQKFFNSVKTATLKVLE